MQHIIVSGLALVLAVVGAVPQGRADDFPSRPLHLIIGFPPGSAADITARLVGDAMSQTCASRWWWKAGLARAAALLRNSSARAPADGYTLYIGTSSNLTSAAISPNVQFDFSKAFAPITPLTNLPLILAVHPSLGVSNLKELIELAKVQTRRAHLRLGGSGHRATSFDRAVLRAREHQARSRAIPGQPAGGD